MAERPRLEAVVFDAGGTLVRLDFEWMAATVSGLGAALEAAALRRAEIAGRRRYDASRGAASGVAPPAVLGAGGDTRAYFLGMLEACGVPEAIAGAALERFAARQRETGLWTRPMEGARQALDQVSALGLRAAVVSNSDGRAELHLRDAGVLDGIELVVDSHRVGIEKPEPAIFRIALDHLAVAPGRALFVGDIRSVDEVGAARAGLHFVLVDPYGDYAAEGAPAIRGLDELAAWLAAHFELPPSPGRAGASPLRAGAGGTP